LYNFLNLEHNDILESIIELERLRDKIHSSNLSHDNPSLNLAEWLFGIPLIYHPYGLRSSCIRFKNSLNENAKMHVFTEDVIEECHNGIVAWEKSSNVQPILIEGHDDHVKTKQRWKILEKFFQQNNIDYKKIVSIEGNIISKLITLIYLFDYSSIYKSVLDGIDPSPVNSIDYMKSKL
jgi:glucose/mannose-6-phosphate isomerase